MTVEDVPLGLGMYLEKHLGGEYEDRILNGHRLSRDVESFALYGLNDSDVDDFDASVFRFYSENGFSSSGIGGYRSSFADESGARLGVTLTYSLEDKTALVTVTDLTLRGSGH